MNGKRFFKKLVAVAMAALFLFGQVSPAMAANSGFTQSDWSDGQNANAVATDSANRDGLGNPWKRYASSDGNVRTIIPESVSVSPVSSAMYGNAQFPAAPAPIIFDTQSDFNKYSAKRNIAIDNSGANNGSLKLQNEVQDPFYSTLGHWSMLPANPITPTPLGYYVNCVFALVKGGGSVPDYVYALWSGVSSQTQVARWNAATEKWEILGTFEVQEGAKMRQVSIGGGSDAGASLAYPGSGDLLYLLRGSGTKEFYSYSMSAGTWTRLQDFPENVLPGGSIVATKASPLKILGVGGANLQTQNRSNRSNVYVYSSTGWGSAPATSLPFTVSTGGGMIYTGGSWVYVFRGSDTVTWTKFTEADYGTDSSTLEDPPSIPEYIFRYGTSISYPGSGIYIYSAPSTYYWKKSTDFLRLNTTNDKWEYSPLKSGFPKQVLTRPPIPMSGGKGFFYYKDGANPKIYLLKPNVRLSRPFVYDLTTNKWEEAAANIQNTGNGSATATLSWDGGDSIYRASTYGQLAKYSIMDNQWEDLEYPNYVSSYTQGSGCEFLPMYNTISPTSGGLQYPFYSPGDDNYRGMSYCNGYIYLMSASGRQAFARYNTANRIWQPIATPPRPVSVGCSVAAVTTASGQSYIYAFPGNSTSEFWRYAIPDTISGIGGWERLNLASKTWQATQVTDTTVIGLPYHTPAQAQLIAYSGTSLVYPSTGDFLYAAFNVYKSTNPAAWLKVFYRFSLTTNTWEPLQGFPADAGNLAYRSVLVYSEYDKSIYFLQGSLNEGAPFAMAKYPLGDPSTPSDPTTTAWQMAGRKPFGGCVAAAYAKEGAGVDAKYYLYVTNDYNAGLYRYDLAAQSWDPPQMEAGGGEGSYGQAVLGQDNDTIYFICGYPGYRAIIWKYSISRQKWFDYIMADPGFTAWTGMSACYPGPDGSGNGDYIYILEGGFGSRLWRMNITSGAFERLNDCVIAGSNVNFFTGVNMVGTGNELYILRGSNTAEAYKYRIYTGDVSQAGTWVKTADAPTAVTGYGFTRSMVRLKEKTYWVNLPSGVVYVHDGTGWAASVDFPAYQHGGAIAAPSLCAATIDSVDYLFLATKSGFYKCARGSGSWEKLVSAPYVHDNGISLIYPGSGDIVYAVTHSRWTGMMRYSISQNVWDQPSPAPRNGNFIYTYNPSLAALGDGDSLYFRNGSQAGWDKYSIANKAWTQVSVDSEYFNSANQRMIGTGDTLIATLGNSQKALRKYDTNSWSSLADIPDITGAGSDLCLKNGYIYMTKGGGTNTMYRYSFSNTWETATPVPANVAAGGSLCSGNGGYIYCLRGEGASDFYRYDASFSTGLNGVWETLTPMPAVSGRWSYGASASCYPGFGDGIYVVPSGNIQHWEGMNKLFYKYSISETDTAKKWKELESLPLPVPYDFALVYPGSGSYMYMTTGAQQWGFIKYLAFYEGEYVSEPRYVGNNAGFDTVSWAANDKGNIEVRIRTWDSPDMVGAPRWEDCPRLTSGRSVGQGQISSVTDSHKYLQYKVKMLTEDETAIPELHSLRVDYKIFPIKQELVSSPFNAGSLNNRIMKLRWTKSLPPPPGTDIRFQLSTSPDGNSWSDWYGPGPDETQDFRDTYSVAKKSGFSYRQQGGPEVVEIANEGGIEGARLKKLYSDFAHTQRIVFDNTSSAISYKNQVFTVDIAESNINFWDGVNADGSDIRFINSDGETIFYNIAKFDYPNKVARLLVKLSSLPANGKSDVYLKYGKPGAVSQADPKIMAYPTNGLVTFLNFDEGTGSQAADNTGAGHNGALYNGTSWTADGINGTPAIRLGQSAYSSVAISKPSDFLVNDHTVAFNVRFRGTPGGYGSIFNNQGQTDRDPGIWQFPGSYSFHWKLDPNNTGTSDFGPGGETTDFSPNKWYHVAGVKNGNQLQMYVDGNKVGIPITVSNPLSKGGAIVTIGSMAANYASGILDMDNFAFYNRSLNDAEVIGLSQGSVSYIPYYFYAVSESNACSTLGQDWTKRLAVSIDNRSGGELRNYQLQVNLTASQEDFWNSCRSDGADIRFIDFEGNAEGNNLPYWRGPDTFNYMNKSASLWVKVPLIPAGQVKTIYLYYGYSGQGAPIDVSTLPGTMTNIYFDKSDTASRSYPEAEPNISALSLSGTNFITVPDSSSLTPASRLTVEADINFVLSPSEWLPGFMHRKMLTVTNTTGIAITNKNAKFDVNRKIVNLPDMDVKSDYGDLRFVDAAGKKVKYRILAYDASKATVLVLIDSLSAGAAKNIYMYYGSDNAVSESDATLKDNYLGTTGQVRLSLYNYSALADPVSAATMNSFFASSNLIYLTEKTPENISGNQGWLSWYCIYVTGFIYAPTTGNYTFSTDSDEVSELRMGDYLEFNKADPKGTVAAFAYGARGIRGDAWRGANTTMEYAGSITLSQGWNPFVYRMQQSTNAEGYRLYWKKPGDTDYSVIPSANYRMTNVAVDGPGLAVPSFDSVPTQSSEETQPDGINKIVVSKAGSYGLKFTNSGLTASVKRQGLPEAALSTTSYDINTLSHVAMKYDGSSISLFVNGSHVSGSPLQVTGSQTIERTSAPLVIGQGIKGFIDEVRVWSTARSRPEINVCKYGNIKGSSSDLTGMGMALYLKCNENALTSFSDSTSNGNNGSITSASWLARPFPYVNEKPVAQYHFNEASGNALDASGNDNTASPTVNLSRNNSDIMSPCAGLYKFTGASLNFPSGAGAYMTAVDSPSLRITKGLTIECWVRPKDASIVNKQVILAKGDDSATTKTSNYMLYCASGEIGLSYIDSSGAQQIHQTTGANFTQNPEAHVAATVDESSRKVYIYINGIVKYSGAMSGGNLIVNSAPLYIGRSAASKIDSAIPEDNVYYTGGLDELRIYNRILSASEILAHYGYYTYSAVTPVNFYYFDPTVLNPSFGAYPTNNPTIQPNLGVFYNATSNIVANGFTAQADEPPGTAIKYQISSDGYNWYWFGTDTGDIADPNTAKWRLAYGAYTSGQVNTAPEISANILSFQQSIAGEGELCYRAYLHSDESAFNTPVLKSVNIRLNTGVHTFYTDQTGAGGVNINHTDAVGDRYFRYKAILYSSGQTSPQLEDVTVEYINAEASISSPVAQTYGFGGNLPITYMAQAVPSGKVTLKYNTYNSNDSLLYSRVIASAQNAADGSHTVNWLLDTADKNLVASRCRVEIISEDIHNAVTSLSPVFTTAALNVTSPAANSIWEIGTAANSREHTIGWNNFGLADTDRLIIQYSLDGNIWAVSDNINIGVSPSNLSTVWDNTWSGHNISPTDNAVIRVFKAASGQEPGNLIGYSAPFALVPIPEITVQPFAKSTYKAGEEVTIAWQTNQSQFNPTVEIDYSTDGFNTTHPITATANIGTSAGRPNSPITGSYRWMPGQQDMFDDITIRVKEVGYPALRDTKQSIEAVSYQTISIVPPTISISSPAATDRWVLGDSNIVSWKTEGAVSNSLLLEYSNDGAAWYRLLSGASVVPNNVSQTDNNYSWTIQEPGSGPGLTAGKVRLRLTDVNKNTIIGISQEFSVLSTAVIEITNPTAGENIILGTTYSIKWRTWGNVLAAGGGDYNAGLDIFYSPDDAVTWVRIAYQIKNTGDIPWYIDSTNFSETDKGRIKIVDRNNPLIYAISNSTFSITHPEVGFDSPESDQSWFAGGLYELGWNTKGTIGNLSIEYFVEGVSASWSPVSFPSAVIETSGQYDPVRHYHASWRVPKYPGRTLRIRLTDTTRPVVTATVAVSLQLPVIKIESPTTANATGANSWALGTDHSIRWTTAGGAEGALSGFRVLFSKTGIFDGTSKILATINDSVRVNTDAERSIPFPWNDLSAAGIDPVSQTARIKIVDTSDSAISQTSDAFTISPPSINIEAPVSASDVYMGQTYIIKWYVLGNITAAYPLKILYDRDINDAIPPAAITPVNFMSSDPSIQDLGEGIRGYDWNVPERQSDYPNYTPGTSRISVEGTYPSLQAGVSESFAIKYPQITVVNPGTIISATDTVTIGWTTNGKGVLTGPYMVEWATRPDFSDARTISDPINPANQYWPAQRTQTISGNWTVPLEAISPNVWLRVRDREWLSGQTYRVAAISGSSFAVLPEPSATINYPNSSMLDPERAWRLGNVVTISWTKNNAGAMSNNLDSLLFYYSLDALVGTDPVNWTWVSFAPTDYAYNEATGERSVKWPVPVTLNPSTNCAIKIYDNVPWRNVPEEHLTVVSDRFEIAIPRIVITYPKAGECWAYGEKPTIIWHSEGAVDNNSLSVYFADNANSGASFSMMISPTLKEANSGTFLWAAGVPPGTATSTPASPNGQIKINATYSNNKPITALSEKVTIISAPTITVAEPGGTASQEYEVGRDIAIRWSSQGISLESVKIEYSSDGFVSPSNIRTIAESIANTPNVGGQFIWTIPSNALVGRNMQLKISKVGTPGIKGLSQNVFRIKGGFDITSPNGQEGWIAKSPQTITWIPRGSVAKVKLQLSWNGGNEWQEPFAADIDNTGSYSWVLPDLPQAQDPKVIDQCRIRISNNVDDTESDISNANFSISYATVIFNVRDFDGGQHLQDIIVQRENTTPWNDMALVSPIVRTKVYPYGTFTTFFTKTDYIDNSVTWATPRQQNAGDAWIVNVSMENKALAQVTFESILTYSYSPGTDILNAVGSLQRKGKLVGITEDDRNKLGNAVLTIYEPNSDTVKYNLVSPPPADRTNWNGMYYFTIPAPTGFVGGQVYPAKLTTEYGTETVNDVVTPRLYPSTTNIEVGVQAQLETLQGTAGMIQQAVQQAIPDKIDEARASLEQKVDNARASLEQKVDTSTAAIKDETSRILAATGTESLPDRLTAAKTELSNIARSEILNRESSIKGGQKLTIRYRTPGSGVVIDVYDSANIQRVAKQQMTQVAEGLYHYDLMVQNGWKKGDYTIVCSDSNGNMDAMILSVTTSNLEDVYGSVMAILGTTQSLSGMREVAESLNSQFSIIETALNKTSKDMVSGSGSAAATSQALDSVFSQLLGMSKQMKQISGSGGINLEKLYKVSVDKKADMMYLKNKTQQLRAAMEISKKMVDNIANKPVTQTWYEYK